MPEAVLASTEDESNQSMMDVQAPIVEPYQIDPQCQARDLKPVIELLYVAGIITNAFHCDANGIPLRIEMKTKGSSGIFLHRHT